MSGSTDADQPLPDSGIPSAAPSVPDSGDVLSSAVDIDTFSSSHLSSAVGLLSASANAPLISTAAYNDPFPSVDELLGDWALDRPPTSPTPTSPADPPSPDFTVDPTDFTNTR